MIETLKRVLSFALAVVLLAYDALSAAFGPVVRPVVAWLGSLEPIARLGRAIAALPPYGALVLLAVPFAIIEPVKILALWWLAQGHAVTGLVALALAHLASLLICERIFHAAKPKLMTIGWFARGYLALTRIRDRALAWLRKTEVWRACAALAVRIRDASPWRRARSRQASRRRAGDTRTR